MAQDTRKDPRAKVLTMTVRYKSATLDEFIEHHSYDVSRGGMFIKTPSPFPPGTLLKFEVKIAEDQKVMQGVGRVVWKREPNDSTDARPAGMGVKFIKIDEQSRKVIDQLAETRGAHPSQYDTGGGDSVAPPPAAPAPKPAPANLAAPAPVSAQPQATASPSPRKSTMIGLGAISSRPPTVETIGSKPKPAEQEESFFPKYSLAEEPAPEDRTVIKQASELLEDALRETGSSLEEVGTAKPAPVEAKKTEAKPASVSPTSSKRDSEGAIETKRAEVSAPSTRSEPKPASLKPSSVRPAATAQPGSKDTRPAATAQPRRAAVPVEEAAASEGGGGGKVVMLLLGVAAVAGAVFFLTRQTPPAPEPEPAAEQVAPPPEPEKLPEPVVTAPTEPAASVVPPTPADTAPVVATPPTPTPPVAPTPVAPTPAPVTPKAVAPVVKPAPVPKVEPAPKTPAPKPEVAPKAEPAPKPVAPKAETPKPETPKAQTPPKAETPAPAPKPKKPATTNDNPY